MGLFPDLFVISRLVWEPWGRQASVSVSRIRFTLAFGPAGGYRRLIQSTPLKLSVCRERKTTVAQRSGVNKVIRIAIILSLFCMNC